MELETRKGYILSQDHVKLSGYDICDEKGDLESKIWFRGEAEKNPKREPNDEPLEILSKVLEKTPTSLTCFPSLNMVHGLDRFTDPLPSKHIFCDS